jgi:iron complex transport system permease protein
LKNLLLIILLLVLFITELIYGPVELTLREIWSALFGETTQTHRLIVTAARLPRALTALLAGFMLSLSGLLMQTVFRNPLAGPSVMGISSGASLGVALVVLLGSAGGYHSHWLLNPAIATGGILGALAVLGMVLLVSKRIPDNTTLLIFGIMTSFFTSSIVDALQYFASNESLRSYINWGMGSFAETNHQQILLLLSGALLSVIIVFKHAGLLNPLLLGDEYAQSMGIRVRSIRMVLLAVTGIMAGLTTAYCGPVAFLGLAVPHIVRTWLKTSDHRTILIPVAISGAIFGLLCDLLSRASGLPLNTIASGFGAPVVLWIILKGRNNQSLI